MSKPKTKRERRHLDRVAFLACAACGSMPVQVHHIREGQGMAQRAGHGLTIPLCPDCHTGSFSVHADRKQFQAVYGSELDMLNDTILLLEEV